MKLGIHMHELWRTGWGLAASLLLASFVALSSAYKIGLPPKLEPRSFATASASTHVLVDAPSSILLDLRENAGQLDQLTKRTVLLGNVMASLPVRTYIAQRAGLPIQRIEMSAPTTVQYPVAIADSGKQRRTTDILRSNDEYRIDVKSNPTVPILDVYAQARSPKIAAALANGAVDGLRDYLSAAATTQGTPASQQVQLTQLGRATGGELTGGLRGEVLGLVFLLAFGLSSAASLVVARVVRGWRAYPTATPL